MTVFAEFVGIFASSHIFFIHFTFLLYLIPIFAIYYLFYIVFVLIYYVLLVFFCSLLVISLSDLENTRKEIKKGSLFG
uniref:Uncharacterized protein n=1 Tax=Lutzomyia longipalpis TaxID=7200 RepID=A0A7G3B9A5_LUTLO